MHVPVLLEPTLRLLDPAPGQIALDCTVGLGGHAAAIVERISPGGRFVGLDLDPTNLALARQRLAHATIAVDLVHAGFDTAPSVLHALGIGGVDLVLADLGFASTQVDDPARGLSFRFDGPLDMRLDPTAPRGASPTAADLVNEMPERELADLIYRYGEERLSRRIARKIAERRRRDPILTTGQLAELCAQAYPRAAARGAGGRRIDPATRTFQALRIAVNDELGRLQRLLDLVPGIVRPGARALIISFHSLEDRTVKQAMRAWAEAGRGRLLTRKVVTADDAELAANPRSRPAKARCFAFDERLDTDTTRSR